VKCEDFKRHRAVSPKKAENKNPDGFASGFIKRLDIFIIAASRGSGFSFLLQFI